MKKLMYIFMILFMFFPVTSYAAATDDNTVIVTLKACVDGDTAKFMASDGETFTARFLAIDTPETVHPKKGEEPFGKEASNYTCDSLTSAKEIKLEYDINSDRQDNYGRELVWVFVDGVLLQDSLISKGYAEVAYLYGDYKYTPQLQDSQAVSQANKLGVWSIDDKNEEIIKENKKETKDKNKSFLDKIIDDLLAKVFDLIDDLLESILKMIEEMI